MNRRERRYFEKLERMARKQWERLEDEFEETVAAEPLRCFACRAVTDDYRVIADGYMFTCRRCGASWEVSEGRFQLARGRLRGVGAERRQHA